MPAEVSAAISVLTDNNNMNKLSRVLHGHNNALPKFIYSPINFRFNSDSITKRCGS